MSLIGLKSSGNAPVGYLRVILGPMFSGKTSELISIYRHNQIAQIPTLVVNYIEDTRYDAEKLSTHDGLMIPCTRLKHLGPVFKLTRTFDAIIINEGQFFDDLYEVVKGLLKLRKTIYVCGLDGDYQQKKFGQVLDIIPLADEVEKRKALCALCRDGTEAAFTRRLTNETEQKVIGSENYIPVCRGCHRS